MSINNSLPPQDPNDDGHATTAYPPGSAEETAAPPEPTRPGADDPSAAPTADFPTAKRETPQHGREATRGGAADGTAAQEMTGDYTPGGAPDGPAAGPAIVPRVRADRYTLQRFHAKGGMGEVWLAEDRDVGRPVALKRMRRQGSLIEQERFLREARITGQLEHPGIVPIHELGTDENGQPVYVMKFIHGRTLSDAVKDYREGSGSADVPREVQLLRLLEVFVALCQTVAYAHSRGVLHRDIKPDNVMLGPYGETLVLDWGLAKVIGKADGDPAGRSVTLGPSGESLESVAGSVRGTPGYMPPEMAAGRVEDIDQLSDVYLLGATLYHILTGRQPRRGKSLHLLLAEATTLTPELPRALDPTIPKPLEAICNKAMAMAKAGRYPSAIALAEDVQRYLAGEPVSAYPEGFATRAWRWARRHRKALGRAAIGAVILAVTLTGFVLVRDARKRQRTAEERAAEESKARQEEAELRQKQEEARKRLADFARLADQARFYLANVDPATEQAPYYDRGKGTTTGRVAVGCAATLADLPLSDGERDAVKEQQYDLLLLLAQADMRESFELLGGIFQAQPDPQSGLDLLAEAEGLRPASAGLHRLRAECYRLLKDARADEEQKRADSGDAPATALDHFLLGERYRAEAFRPAGAREDFADWRPNRDLLSKALDQYRAALRLNPDHFWAHYQIGRCYLSLGQEAQAVEALGTCVALRRDSPWGYLTRGLALARLNRFAEAEADLTQALTLDPDQLPARLDRGYVLSQQEGPEKEKLALDDFDAVLAAPPAKQLIEAAYYRGLIHLKHQRWDEALADFDSVAAEKPEFRAVHRLRAILHLRRKEKEKALDDLTACLAAGRPLDPKSAAACEGRGRLLMLIVADLPHELHTTAKTLALVEFKRATALGDRSPTLSDAYASLMDSLGEYKQAIEHYSAALNEKPNDVKTLTKRGWARVNLEKLEDGEADFAAVVRLDPAYGEAHAGLGYVHALRKNAETALREAHLATLYGAGEYGVLHNVACVYSVLGRGDAKRTKEYQDLALDSLRRAVDLWKRGGKTHPNELALIEGEPAFGPDLRSRPEFKEIVTGDKP
ncbi:MAG TPA: tetratricopeptide repeat protein [Gemmataceae bacterium]|nr:tetratricopeptide repeat protein [Gemmataceae bacterium]